VSVIDPGVGTTRSSIAIRTRSGIYYIAPNNGILTLVVRRQGADAVYELEPGKINPRWIRGTFDGRDLYSPAGALLASSGGNLDRIGRPIGVEDIVLIDFAASVVHKESRRVTGEYTETDYPYGNVWTNITEADLVSAGLSVGGTLLLTSDALALEIPFVTTFADVPKGAPLAYINSDGALAFALNMGNFQRKYGLKEGAKITVAARH
jgi:S-adenosylmethionine hydrolase